MTPVCPYCKRTTVLPCGRASCIEAAKRAKKEAS